VASSFKLQNIEHLAAFRSRFRGQLRHLNPVRPDFCNTSKSTRRKRRRFYRCRKMGLQRNLQLGYIESRPRDDEALC